MLEGSIKKVAMQCTRQPTKEHERVFIELAAGKGLQGEPPKMEKAGRAPCNLH